MLIGGLHHGGVQQANKRVPYFPGVLVYVCLRAVSAGDEGVQTCYRVFIRHFVQQTLEQMQQYLLLAKG